MKYSKYVTENQTRGKKFHAFSLAEDEYMRKIKTQRPFLKWKTIARIMRNKYPQIQYTARACASRWSRISPNSKFRQKVFENENYDTVLNLFKKYGPEFELIVDQLQGVTDKKMFLHDVRNMIKRVMKQSLRAIQAITAHQIGIRNIKMKEEDIKYVSSMLISEIDLDNPETPMKDQIISIRPKLIDLYISRQKNLKMNALQLLDTSEIFQSIALIMRERQFDRNESDESEEQN